MNLPAPERSFYFVGGSLPRGAASYVMRRADEDLLSALLKGEFCSVLTSRQMGKSSLMIHTVMRLQERGVFTGVIDLTSLGQNLTIEQWYRGMLNRAAIQLDLEDALEEFWSDHAILPPLERWMAALQQVALPSLHGPLVIFVDEIDMVRSLPFPTDEFFAGIRACFNRRDSEPELTRLTFCLLGVASPSDLIQADHITPFNIGRRIELHDFTGDEASVLSIGISISGRSGASLLQRTLYWTGGHPYLTQRLCANIAEDPCIQTERDVDRLCESLFFSHEAVMGESNLVFVRNSILKSHADVHGLLDLYARVYSGRRVRDDSSALCDVLRLSGIVTRTTGTLKVRNRIYERVFNATWIRSNIPGSELRRQQAARRRGFLQAAALFGAIAIVIGSLGGIAYENYRFAAKKERDAHNEADRANNFLYIADMNLAQRAWEATPVQVEHIKELLAETRSNKYRGFVWGYWNHLCHLDLLTLRGHTAPVNSVAVSADGSLIATGSADGTARLWDAVTGHETLTLNGQSGPVASVAFAPDGRHILTVNEEGTRTTWDAKSGHVTQTQRGKKGPIVPMATSPDRTLAASVKSETYIRLTDAVSGRTIFTMGGHTGTVSSVAFSRDGAWLATGGMDNTAKIWDVKTGQLMYSLIGHTRGINTVAFSPDGRRIVTGSSDGTAKVWAASPRQDALRISDITGPISALAFSPNGNRIVLSGARTVVVDARTGQMVARLTGANGVVSITYSPDGARVAGGGPGGMIRIWDAHTGRPIVILSERRGSVPPVTSVAFSPDGEHLVSGSGDHTARIWDTMTGRALARLVGHADAVKSVAFSPDSRQIATGSADNTARIWNAATGGPMVTMRGHSDSVNSVAFSPDGRNIVTASSDNTCHVWDVRTGNSWLTLKGHSRPVRSATYSPDGQRILTSSEDRTAKVWNSQVGKEILTLRGHRNVVSCAAFSPDYDRIATGSYDGSASVVFSNCTDFDAVEGPSPPERR